MELGDEKLRIKDFQLGKMNGWWSLLLRKETLEEEYVGCG